jgi:hypothetical protein
MKKNAILKGEVTRSALLPRNDGTIEDVPHKILSMKAVGAGKELTDEQLAKINSYARKALTKEQVFYIRLLMAHNGIDRDEERFDEKMLTSFAKTLPGKGFFVQGHPSGWSGTGGPGEGLHFDSQVEQMTPKEFKALTGEEIKLPDDVDTVHALMSDAYILALPGNADTRAKIDAGIIRHASIGFKAPLYSITDDNGNHIYGEYRPKGEALEGSLVWLGAQPGAGVMKGAKPPESTQNAKGAPEPPEEPEPMKGVHMKILAQRLSKEIGKEFTAENLGDEILLHLAEINEKMKSLEASAKDGDAYRDVLVEDTIHYGAMVGEIPTTEAAQRKEAEFIKTWPLTRIKFLRDKYEKAARKMYPDRFTLQGKEEMDRQRAILAAQRKQEQTGTRKDLSTPQHNELLQ